MGSKSAQKVARASIRRQQRNKSIRSRVKTDIAGAEKFIAEGDMDAAGKAVAAAVTALDTAAEKKVLHPNNAARRKSRLMKKLNKGVPRPETGATPEKAA